MPRLEMSQNLYARISERAFAIKRDIDLAAGPNPIDPCMARAKQNIGRLLENLKWVEIVPEKEAGGESWDSPKDPVLDVL